MTHAQLKTMTLEAAIEHIRSAPICLVLQVMRDPDYDYRLRGEAAKVAAPFFHGQLSVSAIEDEQ
jgi:hypothetical protein